MADYEMTDRIKSLANSQSGSGHDNFLKGIVVQFDVKFTNKVWVEAERYHWFDIVSSQSTMHCIKRFEIDKNCIEYTDKQIMERAEQLRVQYLEESTEENFLRLIYSIPSGFYLCAGITTNYLQLKTIYHQRANHRLPEWREFCEWIEILPYSELITGHIIADDFLYEIKDAIEKEKKRPLIGGDLGEQAKNFVKGCLSGFSSLAFPPKKEK